eukprot:6175891-Pleurochrysis_carterae.AAC.2
MRMLVQCFWQQLQLKRSGATERFLPKRRKAPPSVCSEAEEESVSDARVHAMSESECDERTGSSGGKTRTKRAQDDDSESDNETGGVRPSNDGSGEDQCSDEVCRLLVCRAHQCTNKVNMNAELLQCDYQLWGRLTPAAVAALRAQRVHFRKELTQAEQKHVVHSAIEYEGIAGNLHKDSDPIRA